jgi:hypothetical protein
MADVIALGNLLLGIFDRLLRLLGRPRPDAGRSSQGNRVPTLGLVHQRCRRTLGKEAGKPAVHLMADYLVTNGTDEPVVIVRAQVAYRRWLLTRTVNQMQGPHAVPPRSVRDLRILFRITPPPCPDNKDLKCRVALVDNLNRVHDGGRLVFRQGFTGPD